MLPVAIFFYSGALAGSLVFLAVNIALLYAEGYTFAWARTSGVADTYLMQLAIVPLLAFVFAYPNRLYAQLRRAQQRLAVVEREQILLSERTRIAGSLHDSVAQILFGIGLLVESAQARLTATHPASTGMGAVEGQVDAAEPVADTLQQVHELATRGNREMRRAIYSLREVGPDGDGLPAALDSLLGELAARTGVETHLAVNGVEQRSQSAADGTVAEPQPVPGAAPSVTLPDPVALALYKVAREALANVEKHAEAINVWASLELDGSQKPSRVTLAIRDDGHGFRRPLLASPGDADEDEVGVPHFGLGNMRAAVESVGGRFEIASSGGRGTTVTATVPLR
jgi:two-component system NarL family sensor kinase